ncbi:sugar transporter domain-containing protein [Hirsutella rhossiliensis]|uniref:Sugar transporter domain-containing protein n=1 Tax=Hirsutella rhossiliensis TaxID=111463 RepID=A0A9P8SF15_9HYPO|nr:sugar transporter domain-containing protein [Hirsutella rhossiliensis]KAH0958551.1 sugar transporter domain-containing protein [Hirsutella rhossiliensis]
MTSEPPKSFAQHNVDAASDTDRVEPCQLAHVTWYREPHLRRLYLLSIFLLIGSATTGFDCMLQNTSQQMDAWKAFFPDHADVNKLGILINMYNIGSITAFFIAPYMADIWGRKPTIMVGCVIMIAGACVTAFSSGYGMYIGGRFVLGFGNSLSHACSPMLLTEICHPQHRGRMTTVYNCLWNLGSLFVSLAGWATASIANDWSWRSITFLQAATSIIQLVGVWWVPESPRFLVSRGKPGQALAMLAEHHGGGDPDNATVAFEYRKIKETIEAERKANNSTSYLDFFKTKGNRWRLTIVVSIGIISQYSGNALFSNYIDIVYEGAGIQAQHKKLALSAGKTILDLLISVAAALSVDKVGRRPLFLTSSAGMVAAFACWTIPNGGIRYTNGSAGYAQIVFVWIFGIFYDIGFAGLLIAYTLEILPYHLRARGFVILNIVVQAVLAIGNQTNKLAWNNLPRHWNFMLFYTLWNLCEFVFVYFVYVETKGPTLEEIARIFDGQDEVPSIRLDKVDNEARVHDQGYVSETRAA